MRCRGCQQQLSESIDGDLSPRRQRAVEEHLAGCAVCRSVRDELRAVCGLMSELAPPPVAVANDELPWVAAAEAPRDGEPSDALWGRIDAALDADEREHQRKRNRWRLLVPAMGSAALVATVAVAQGVQNTAARRGSQALDVAMKEASARAVRSVEERATAEERELLGLTGEGAPIVARGVDPFEEGFDAIDARLAARQRRILDEAEVALSSAGHELVVVEAAPEARPASSDLPSARGGAR